VTKNLTPTVENSAQLEETADLLTVGKTQSARIYTEKALTRKIRLERSRQFDFDETALPDSAAHYILKSHIKIAISSAHLTKFQSAVVALEMMGWSAADISEHFNLPYYKITRAIRIARRKIRRGSSPYDGLWEVYWSEVRRRGYRRPRSRT